MRHLAKRMHLKWYEEGFQKYFRNASWMLGGRIATMAISFVATLYIARNLGPTNFGQLSYALSVVGLLGFLAPLGLDGILYRELIRHPERKRELLGTTLYLRLLAGAVVGVATILIALTAATDDVSRILICILSATFVLNAFQIINFDFLARAQSQYQAIITILVSLVLNALKITIIALDEGIIYLALVLLFESVLYAVLYTIVYHRKTDDRIQDWRWDSAVARSLLTDSLPIIFVTGLVTIYARIDQVFIKHMIDAEAVGIYDAAVRLVDIWNFIPGALGAALFPAIVNAEKVSHELFLARTKKVTMLFVLIPIAIAIPITLFAHSIVHLLYGPAFAGTAEVLQIYIWSFLGTSLAIHVQAYLTLKNERVVLVLSSLVPMFVNVGLNLLWIPQYGIIGAAYATVIAYSMVPMFIVFRRRSAKN